MEDSGLSYDVFARKLNVAAATVGQTAQYWLQFQTDYDLYHASKRVDTSELKLLTKAALERAARKRKA